METLSLSEASVRLGRSERTIRRMVERGELAGQLVLERGRYRWNIALEDLPPAVIDRPDLAETLARIETKLDELLAFQRSASAGTLPIAPELPPPRRRWWQWFVWRI